MVADILDRRVRAKAVLTDHSHDTVHNSNLCIPESLHLQDMLFGIFKTVPETSHDSIVSLLSCLLSVFPQLDEQCINIRYCEVAEAVRRPYSTPNITPWAVRTGREEVEVLPDDENVSISSKAA